jgi:hypothetical protein
VTAAPQPQAAPVAWAMADQLDDKLMIGFSVVRTGHPDQKRGHFTVPLYAAATQPPKVQHEMQSM